MEIIELLLNVRIGYNNINWYSHLDNRHITVIKLVLVNCTLSFLLFFWYQSKHTSM